MCLLLRQGDWLFIFEATTTVSYFRYSKLPLAGKILLPVLSVFLGMWTVGTVSVGYLKTSKETYDLKVETQSAAAQISKEIENTQEILSFKTQSITNINSVKAAIETSDRQKLLHI